MDFTTEIKQQVTMFDVADRYGFDVHKKHFIICPFHNEKTPSMKLYDGEKGCYCFGCGYSADVIGFVRRYFNLDFKQTLQKLNDDFSLNLPIGKQLSQKQQMNIAKENHRRKQEKEKKQNEYQEILSRFLTAHTELLRLERQRDKHAPKFFSDELHPLFIDYLQNIEEARQNFEYAESELIKWKAQN